MKKRFLRLACMFLCVSLLFSFCGCDLLNSLTGECVHEYGEYFEDANGHYQVCDLCGEQSEIKSHEYDGYIKGAEKHYQVCTLCGAKTEEQAHDFVENGAEKSCFCGYKIVEAKGAISFHFMMLGNNRAGDCVYIKAGENDILIDSGSYYDSMDSITAYVDAFVPDKKLEYVIATHADQDHIACFAGSTSGDSLFDYYECETIIDFPKSNKTTKVYERYQSERAAEVQAGAKHYTALQCYNNQDGAQRVYNLTEDGNVKMEILYNYYYENKSSDENNYSVCVMFYHGSRQFLFTGDLEKEGEEYLAEKYDFTQVELFKAGHHGSPTSSNDCLLKEIQPKICVACCCAGSVEYTDNLENTFPSQAVINRIAPYTDKFFVPITTNIKEKGTLENGNPDYENDGDYIIMNGNIIVSSNEEGVEINCSNNNTLLKDTEWFKNYRITPDAWMAAA